MAPPVQVMTAIVARLRAAAARLARDVAEGDLPFDDGVRDVDKSEVVVACVLAKRRERVVHLEPGVLGERPLRLFHRDAAVQRVLELLGQEPVFLGRTMLE